MISAHGDAEDLHRQASGHYHVAADSFRRGANREAEGHRATGDPVNLGTDIAKIKSTVAKVQSSPAYKIGMGAWSGGLVGAAKGAGTFRAF